MNLTHYSPSWRGAQNKILHVYLSLGEMSRELKEVQSCMCLLNTVFLYCASISCICSASGPLVSVFGVGSWTED